MNNPYQKTVYACYIGYISQGIANNLAPLLFITFIDLKWVSLSTVTLLTTVNFGMQLLTDFLSVYFVDKIGYRRCIVAAHVLDAAGLIGLATLPDILPLPFLGLIISVLLYALGGGLLEVLVSPIVEACPSDDKARAMSLLHSFYCWGVVAVVALSTFYIAIFGRENWRALCWLWALVPACNAVFFTRVPINTLTEEGRGMTVRELFGNRLFLIFMLIMFAAGASELAMSQWASAFAESGLRVSKELGDLAGPCAFALLMGFARALYAKKGERLNIRNCILFSSSLCTAAYLLSSLSEMPWLALLGCGICGFSVGIMWPGVFSLASASLPRGGTAMFALLALAGDLGCTGGPTVVGFVSSAAGGSLRAGLFAAAVFPVVMIAGILLLRRITKS